MGTETIGTPMLWGGFVAFVVAMLVVDLGVFHRKAHVVRFKEAFTWSLVWVCLAVVFCVGIYFWFGSERALAFATGYLLEKALAVDNIFIFVVIFSTFAIPAVYQHRVLFWGVIGALFMRALFIVAGAAFVHRFAWSMYVFGAILLVTGIKLLLQRDEVPHPEKNFFVRLIQRIIPARHEFDGDRFTMMHAGRRYATPLLLALVAVEVTDLIFAVDSIPAIFAITHDPFIVFTSNIFAILGLRSLYFVLARIVEKFVYLKVGLSIVLLFVGTKMLLMDVYKIPVGLSLGIIAAILGISIVVSILKTRASEGEAVPADPNAEPHKTNSAELSARVFEAGAAGPSTTEEPGDGSTEKGPVTTLAGRR